MRVALILLTMFLFGGCKTLQTTCVGAVDPQTCLLVGEFIATGNVRDIKNSFVMLAPEPIEKDHEKPQFNSYGIMNVDFKR
jgi:hypothetical protein